MPDPALVVAAGAVVLRRRSGTSQVLLVHRPKYDDWAFPKGKLDPHEPVRTAAVREVLEETGLHIALGPPLADQAYPLADGRSAKVVHYWVGRCRGGDDVGGYARNAEIDDLRWVDVDRAARMLTYAHDRDTLAEAVPFVRRTGTLAVVRHAKARSRKRWKGDDRERTLTRYGERQADRLPPLLEAYGVERLVSSSSRRCWTTLAPYAEAAGLDVEVTDDLSEEDATDKGIGEEVDRLVGLREPVAVCSHRPVLPMIFEALHLDPPALDLAATVVVHHREGRIAALERIPAPPGH